MLTAHKTQLEEYMGFGSILLLSGWGLAMVIASFLFLYIGRLLDGVFGTPPNFMLGLFFLAIFLCIMRLYEESTKKIKDL